MTVLDGSTVVHVALKIKTMVVVAEGVFHVMRAITV